MKFLVAKNNGKKECRKCFSCVLDCCFDLPLAAKLTSVGLHSTVYLLVASLSKRRPLVSSLSNNMRVN